MALLSAKADLDRRIAGRKIRTAGAEEGIPILCLSNVATGEQEFQLLRNGRATVIDKRADDRVVTGVLPIADGFLGRVKLKVLEIVHHVPRAVDVKLTEVIAVIPGFHILCMVRQASIF